MKRPLSLLTLFFAALMIHAQTVPTKASPDEIDHWLRSGDPRMVAWGAYYAAKTAETDKLPLLASLAENYQALPLQEYDSHGNYVPRTPEQKQHFDSMQAVLDSLIQLHGTVAYEAVVAVLPDFPAQALTLFATMPEPERSQYAAALYSTRDLSDKPYDGHQLSHQQMIHMAAAILALNPPPGFTATLLNETTVTLKISVTDDDEKRGGVFGGMCGDSFGLEPAPGWPQPYTYVVEQYWQSENTKERILIPSEPAITTRRALSNSSCSTLPGFTSVQRLLLAQQEADLLPEALGDGTLQYDNLRYRGPTDYLTDLSVLLESHMKPFRTLASTLAAKSFLTAAEAATALPSFSVEILDHRLDKTQALPQPTSFDPHVILGPYKPETDGSSSSESSPIPKRCMPAIHVSDLESEPTSSSQGLKIHNGVAIHSGHGGVDVHRG